VQLLSSDNFPDLKELSSIRMKYLYGIGGNDTISYFGMAMTLPLSP